MTDPRQPVPGERLIDLVEYNENNIPPTPSYSRPHYDDPETRQKQSQNYRWSALVFEIKYWLIVGATIIAMAVLLGILALVVWLVYVFVIHYTAPGRGWLEPEELYRLGTAYGNFAKFAAPTALITNAWLVAYFGTRRWATRDRN